MFFQMEDDEKLKKRKERFGASAAAATPAVTGDVEVALLFTSIALLLKLLVSGQLYVTLLDSGKKYDRLIQILFLHRQRK